MIKNEWQIRAAKLFCACVWMILLYVAVKYFGDVLMTVSSVFVISAAIYGASKRIEHRMGISGRLCAVILLTLVLLAVLFTVFYLCSRLVLQIKELILALPIDTADITSEMLAMLSKLPIFSGLIESSAEVVSAVSLKLLASLGNTLTSFLARIFAATPKTLLTVAVTIISCYYMSVDFERICKSILSVLPKEVSLKISHLKAGAARTALEYLRAYSKLFLITLGESFLGLLFLCPQYSLIGALCIATVDILPVVGAGLVLIPWGISQLFLGNYFVGCGLLVIYLVMTVIRQVIEPRILGSAVGISPLEAILLMFVGYRVLGVVGMMSLPLLFSILKKIKKSGGP